MPVEGGARLRRILNRIPEAVAAEVKREIDDAAELTKFEMLKRVPVREGDLAASIEIWKSRDGLSVKVGPGARTRRAKKRGGWRAKFIEFGTRPHSLAKGAKLGGKTRRARRQGQGAQHPGAAPRPFIVPAFQAAKAIFRPRINAAVNRALRHTSHGTVGHG